MEEKKTQDFLLVAASQLIWRFYPLYIPYLMKKFVMNKKQKL